MIALKQPSLNKQLDFDQLILFGNGITYIFYNLITEFKLINTYYLLRIYQFIFCYKLLVFLLQMI